MRARRVYVAVRLLVVVVVSTAGFVLLQGSVRRAEASISAGLLERLGADRIEVVSATSVQVQPSGEAPIRALITPSCSATASLLAISTLAWVTPRRGRGRRAASAAAALATIFVGNIIRIAASIALGYVVGRASLVLFHDWVGSIFTFAYTLGGFMLMLHLLLPAKVAHAR